MNKTLILSANAIQWLANGERGLSSETIFTHLTGVDALGDSWESPPWDPADLRRCRLLLEACPEMAVDLPKMAEKSKAWAALVEHWDELCKLMDEESPNWRKPDRRESAPKTYELMHKLLRA